MPSSSLSTALYTTTTFPFLFAVMFGGAGHAALLLAFSAWMVLREKQLIAAKVTGEVSERVSEVDVREGATGLKVREM